MQIVFEKFINNNNNNLFAVQCDAHTAQQQLRHWESDRESGTARRTRLV